MNQDAKDQVPAATDEIAALLRSLKPNQQHRKNQQFSELYPVIREMLDMNVTQRAILDALESKGLKLHPARFKQLMAAEAETRAADGSDAMREGMS